MIYIVSREGATGPIHRNVYTGTVSVRALKSRLTKERAGGDRWAAIAMDGQSEYVSPEDAVAAKSRSGTPTTPNAKRHRKMGMITMAPESWQRLDRLRNGMPRGAYIEELLRRTP